MGWIPSRTYWHTRDADARYIFLLLRNPGISIQLWAISFHGIFHSSPTIAVRHRALVAYLEPAVDVPEVEPRAGAGHDVAGQLVDRHRRHGAGVARQVLHVAVPREVPDDGGAVPRTRDGDAPVGAGGEAGDGVGVPVEHLLDQQLLHLQTIRNIQNTFDPFP